MLLSCVWLFATPLIVAHQASLSMGFSRQEYWGGLLFPSPGESFWHRDQTQIKPNPAIEPGSPELQADSLPFKLPAKSLSSLKFIQFFLLLGSYLNM